MKKLWWSGKFVQNWVSSFECLKRRLLTRQTLPLRCGLPGGNLRLTGESRSTKLPLGRLTLIQSCSIKWQKQALTAVAAIRGAELDPATATELRHLRALARRPKQELNILKKTIASAYFKRGR